MKIYTAKHGDSLQSVCKFYNHDYLRVARDNELSANQPLVTGQTIVLRDSGHSERIGKIEANGYVFPNTPPDIFAKALDNLTYISVFSYQARPEGSLIEPDEHLTYMAVNSGKKTAMVVTNTTRDGFDSDLASSLLNSAAARESLLKNALDIMEKKNYSALTIDFEYVLPQDREAFNCFIKQAGETMRKAGFTLSTALAPKTSPDMKGALYEAHDYAFHGKSSDRVILLTYDWGFTFSPPMPVAPMPEIRKVLDYAISVIPSEKILLSVPNYGYDWKLPYRPDSAASAIGNCQAVELARRANTVIQYDEKAKSPYFRYFSQREHEVWFEDARSIEAKLDLVSEYNLAGVSYWTINRSFPQCWLVQNGMYDV